jgi:hypothetical protein
MSSVTNLGALFVRTIPTSLSNWRTFGFREAAGLTPPLSALHPRGALELNNSSERTLLKVFSTHTKRMVFKGVRACGG